MVPKTWLHTGTPSNKLRTRYEPRSDQTERRHNLASKKTNSTSQRRGSRWRRDYVFTLCHWVLRFRCRTGVEWNDAAPPSCCCAAAAAAARGCVRWPENRADLMLFIGAGYGRPRKRRRATSGGTGRPDARMCCGGPPEEKGRKELGRE